MNNFKFININDCFYYMNLLLENDEFTPYEWIEKIDQIELFDRIKGMFFADSYKSEYDEMIMKYIYNLSDNQRIRLFYVNNLHEFTRRHLLVKQKIRNIFESIQNLDFITSSKDIPSKYAGKFEKDNEKNTIKAYNSFVQKEYFMDPNSPPDSIINLLKELDTYYMEYVYSPLITFDKIHRLKYFIRKTVCVVDTDSNILSLDSWVRFCKEEILQGDYGRDEEKNDFIIINTLTYFMTTAIAKILNEYGLHSHIPDDYRPRFNMKNELIAKRAHYKFLELLEPKRISILYVLFCLVF